MIMRENAYASSGSRSKVFGHRQGGVTMIELLIVVVVVAILAGIGYPSYMDSVRKSARQVAKGVLLEVVSRQEQSFVNNKRYAADLTNLGYPADGFYIDNEGRASANAAGSKYLIELSAVTASTFTLQAVPQNDQAQDSTCGTLSITDTGTQNASSTHCW